jgi:hypothetical protein
MCDCKRDSIWRRAAVITAIAALTALVLGRAPQASAQATTQVAAAPLAPVEPRAYVPFGPGERLEYQVKLGFFSAGNGFIGVESVDTTRGRETYELVMGITGGIPGARVNDRYQSWLDTRTLASRHFIRDVHEVRYRSFKEFAIYPEEGRWVQLDDADEFDTMSASTPLDELSFLFWLRTVPLEVGQTYTYRNYFKNDGNPVVLKVLRRERRKVPAGEFNTIVVQPTIQTSGLFSQGGKAEVYLTDDADRHVVYLRSEVPLVGSITLHLRSIRRGTPLPAVAARPNG